MSLQYRISCNGCQRVLNLHQGSVFGSAAQARAAAKKAGWSRNRLYGRDYCTECVEKGRLAHQRADEARKARRRR